jgi:hypothetical protein
MLELLDLLASSPVLVDLISSPLTPLYTASSSCSPTVTSSSFTAGAAYADSLSSTLAPQACAPRLTHAISSDERPTLTSGTRSPRARGRARRSLSTITTQLSSHSETATGAQPFTFISTDRWAWPNRSWELPGTGCPWPAHRPRMTSDSAREQVVLRLEAVFADWADRSVARSSLRTDQPLRVRPLRSRTNTCGRTYAG